MLSKALIWTPMNPSKVFGFLFVAHGRAFVGIDRQRDGLLRVESVGDATHVLTFFTLDAVRIQSSEINALFY